MSLRLRCLPEGFVYGVAEDVRRWAVGRIPGCGMDYQTGTGGGLEGVGIGNGRYGGVGGVF